MVSNQLRKMLLISGHKRTLQEFKSLVECGARSLIAAKPHGFTFPDLAAHLNYDIKGAGSGRKLRRQLIRLCEEDIIYAVDRGIFIAGSRFDEGRPDVAAAIEAAFWNAGGVLSMVELRAELYRDGIGQSEISTQLSKSGRYSLGIPFEGYRQMWCVSDKERLAIPVPGKHQMLELVLIRGRLGAVPVGWGVEELKAFRARIGVAIRDARNMADVDIECLAQDRELRDALKRCVGRATDIYPWHPHLQARFNSYADWWADAVGRDGEAAAFADAWVGLEDGDHYLTGIQIVLDVPCWVEMGRALNADPALLSRGAIAPAHPVPTTKNNIGFGNIFR